MLRWLRAALRALGLRLPIENAILTRVVDSYVGSGDFSGTYAVDLEEELGLAWPDLQRVLARIVSAGQVAVRFAEVQHPPAIRRLPDLPTPEQLDLLAVAQAGDVWAFPTKTAVEARVSMGLYDDRPFTKQLLLGSAQMDFRFFDLAVLEGYQSDPRYDFEFEEYMGSICITDASYECDKTPKKDKILIQSFGLAYKDNGERAVAVPLCRLAGLSPEHQQRWRSHLATQPCEAVADYCRPILFGQFPSGVSVYRAFLIEQVAVNKVVANMGRPALFRQVYEEKRPPEFSMFVRPTRANYNRFANTLDKLISNNIDRTFFQGEVSTEVQTQGTLSMLGEWLRSAFPNSSAEANTIMDCFTCDRLRRPRHVDAHELVQNEYDPIYYSMQDCLMQEAYDAMRTLRLLLMEHPDAQGVSIDDCPDPDEVVRY